MFSSKVVEITSLRWVRERCIDHPLLRCCVGGLRAVNGGMVIQRKLTSKALSYFSKLAKVHLDVRRMTECVEVAPNWHYILVIPATRRKQCVTFNPVNHVIFRRNAKDQSINRSV